MNAHTCRPNGVDIGRNAIGCRARQVYVTKTPGESRRDSIGRGEFDDLHTSNPCLSSGPRANLTIGESTGVVWINCCSHAKVYLEISCFKLFGMCYMSRGPYKSSEHWWCLIAHDVEVSAATLAVDVQNHPNLAVHQTMISRPPGNFCIY
jgi:hypothetical protein